MILSLLTITIAFIWLMVETHYMTIRLASGEIPIHDTTPIKRQPILEPCRIVNAPYREHYTYKVGDFTALELPELTTGNINIFCKRC